MRTYLNLVDQIDGHRISYSPKDRLRIRREGKILPWQVELVRDSSDDVEYLASAPTYKSAWWVIDRVCRPVRFHLTAVGRDLLTRTAYSHPMQVVLGSPAEDVTQEPTC